MTAAKATPTKKPRGSTVVDVRHAFSSALQPTYPDDGMRKARLVSLFMREHLVHMDGDYAFQPFELDKFQVENVINPIFADVDRRGKRKIRKALVSLPRWGGKALAVDTPMLTTDGWKTMGDLQPGDRVFAPDGTPTRVTFVSPVFERHACYRLRFADGQEIVADEDHLWSVNDQYAPGKKRVLDTKALYKRYITGNRGLNERRFSVDVAKPVEHQERAVPIHPYVLGLWLGDGSTTDSSITTADTETVDRIRSLGYRVEHRASYGPFGYRIFGLSPLLRLIGVLGDKHIPDMYARGSIEQRLELLRGLMDSDGYIEEGRPKCEFTSVNIRLATDVLELVRSLGYKATMTTGRATLNGRDCGPKYRVYFHTFLDQPSPFHLTRKTARVRPLRQTTKCRTNKIIKIQRVRSVPTKCIGVEHPTHCYLAGRGLIPTHNSELMAAIVLACMFVEPKYQGQYYVVARDKGMAHIIFDKAKTMILRDPMLRRACTIKNDVIIVNETGAKFQVLPGDRKSVEGKHADVCLIDEYHVHKDNGIYNAMTSGMIGNWKSGGLLLVTSTAGHERKGPLWDLIKLLKKDPHGYVYWVGAEDDDDPHDPKVWRKANPMPWISMADLREAYNTLPLWEFERYHLNRFPAAGVAKAFDSKAWDANDAKPQLTIERRAVVAVDASWERDTTAFILDQVDEDGHHNVVCWIFESEEPGRPINRLTVKSVLLEICLEYDVYRVACDPNFFKTTMLELEIEHGIPVESFAQRNEPMAAACMNLAELIGEGRINHGGDKALREHVLNAGVQLTPFGWRIKKIEESLKIDAAISLAIATYIAEMDTFDDRYIEPVAMVV